MKTIKPQDTLLIVFYDKNEEKIFQKVVRCSQIEAINQGYSAISHTHDVESFCVFDTVYNSKYKE